MDVAVDDESPIGDLPKTETFNAALSNEVESKEEYLLELFGRMLAGPTTWIFMMIMNTEDMTMIS